MDEPREPESRPPADPAYVSLVVETIAVLLVTCSYRLVYFGLGPSATRGSITTWGLVATLAEDAGIALLVLFLLKADLRKLLVPESRRAWLREISWGLALAVAMWFLNRWTFELARSLGFRSGPSTWAAALRDPAVRTTFLLTTPISCLRQELEFRLYFQSRFARILAGKKDLAVLLTSWIFAAVHGYSPAATCGVFSIGLLLGSAFAITGRLPRVVLAHLLYNVTNALIRP